MDVIVEIIKRMNDIMMNVGRLYVKLRCCRVKEWVNVLRCCKCFAYEHMIRECPIMKRLCQKHEESGHLRESCKK